jgi:hypothetical protein
MQRIHWDVWLNGAIRGKVGEVVLFRIVHVPENKSQKWRLETDLPFTLGRAAYRVEALARERAEHVLDTFLKLIDAKWADDSGEEK